MERAESLSDERILAAVLVSILGNKYLGYSLGAVMKPTGSSLTQGTIHGRNAAVVTCSKPRRFCSKSIAEG